MAENESLEKHDSVNLEKKSKPKGEAEKKEAGAREIGLSENPSGRCLRCDQPAMSDGGGGFGPDCLSCSFERKKEEEEEEGSEVGSPEVGKKTACNQDPDCRSGFVTAPSGKKQRCMFCNAPGPVDATTGYERKAPGTLPPLDASFEPSRGFPGKGSGLVGKKTAHNKIKLASISSDPVALAAFKPLNDSGRYVVTKDAGEGNDWGVGTIWQLSEEGGEQILARIIEDAPAADKTQILGEAAVGKKMAKTASIHNSVENTEQFPSNLPLGGTEVEAAIFEEGLKSGDITCVGKKVSGSGFKEAFKVLAARKPESMDWTDFAMYFKKLSARRPASGQPENQVTCKKCKGEAKKPDKLCADCKKLSAKGEK